MLKLITPFGGGKSHTLASLYHAARHCGALDVIPEGKALPRTGTARWLSSPRSAAKQFNRWFAKWNRSRTALPRLHSAVTPQLSVLAQTHLDKT